MSENNRATLIVIDVQEKLFRKMPEQEMLLKSMRQMIQGARVLGLPILWSEQYPEGLGPTIPRIAELLDDLEPISKKSFSCCGEKQLNKMLQATGLNRYLLMGIECHVCVYQTALDLLRSGYEVEVVADAVASRTDENKRIGLERVRRAGAGITSVETILFELLKVAEGPEFKKIIEIVR
jgi:nicotinamidase-related amidase